MPRQRHTPGLLSPPMAPAFGPGMRRLATLPPFPSTAFPVGHHRFDLPAWGSFVRQDVDAAGAGFQPHFRPASIHRAAQTAAVGLVAGLDGKLAGDPPRRRLGREIKSGRFRSAHLNAPARRCQVHGSGNRNGNHRMDGTAGGLAAQVAGHAFESESTA